MTTIINNYIFDILLSDLEKIENDNLKFYEIVIN